MTADASTVVDGSGRGRMPRWRKVLLVIAALLVGFTLAIAATWVGRFPSVEPGPLEAVLDDPTLEVTTTDDRVTLAPVDGDTTTTTVVFYPGAGVPPQAYLATWAPVVREDGVTVVIPTMPLRLAVLDANAAAGIREAVADEASEDDGTWWVGGHSLGGAMAASFLADEPEGTWDGLVLWGAYPSGDALADRDDLAVVSVSGTRDGLTTAEDVEASRANLPDDAVFAVLDGVNHAQFGAYGDQSGDLEATVDDHAARREIATATAEVVGLG